MNLTKYGWAKSPNTATLVYASVGAGTTQPSWCLSGASTTGKSFFLSTNKPLATGTCPSDSTLW